MPRTSGSGASRPQVLVLGGGFGGVGAARALAKSDVDVTVVDQHDFHTFQPLLYQVATDLLEPPTVGHPLRHLFGDQENVTVHEAGVRAIDLDRREVEFTDMPSLGFDYLVLGMGAQVKFFYGNVFVKDYPGLSQDSARIVLVEAGPSLLSMFKADIRSYTRHVLEQRGVEVMTDEVVSSIEPTRVTLKSGTVLRAHTLIWGAGLEAHPITGTLGVELQRGGRVVTAADLSVPDHPEVFAVGDIAWITGKKNQVLPQLGSVAPQSGGQAGKNIARRVAGKDTEPFPYHAKGTMAAIGRGAAVIQMPHGRTIKGKTASLAWGAVHLALLSTGEDRAKAVVDWTWAGFSHERPGRISVTPDDK
jgi:NADH dehydrogenase FAD-containing subunit